MATYKVLQDIEAEDKIFGPFTLKQFILVVIDIILIFVAFRLAISNIFLVIPFIIPITVLTILGVPIGHDQPTETWLLAKLRFVIMPHKRIWNQDGIIELVTITVPKRIEKHYTDGLNQYQVNSRLQALSNTLDSRGWAVKNVAANMYSSPTFNSQDTTDRLVDNSTLPQSVPTIQVAAEDDIMDETNNPVAKRMNEMIEQSGEEYKRQLKDRVRTVAAQPQPDYSFIENRGQATPSYTPVTVAPHASENDAKTVQESDADKALLDKIHDRQKHKDAFDYQGHLKRIKTAEEIAAEERAAAQKQADEKAASTMTKPPDAAKIKLALESDDLKVETVAHLANRKPDDGEVVISLH